MNYRLFIAVVLVLISFYSVSAQVEDCLGSVLVCSDQNINSNPTGSGIDDFNDRDNNSGCLLTQENISEWYRITIRDDAPAGGSELGMIIDPDGGQGEDYDFAVFGPNVRCDSLGGPTRCSYASGVCNFCPQTGLGMGEPPTDFNDDDSDGFSAPLIVFPGEIYFILIDNFDETFLGFDLEWTGPGADFLSCECQLEVTLPMDTTYCESGQAYQMRAGITGILGNDSHAWQAISGDIGFLSDVALRDPIVQFPPDFTGVVAYELCVSDDAGFTICQECDTIQISVAADPNIDIQLVDTLCLGQNYAPIVNVNGGVWTGDIDPSGQIFTSNLGVGDFNAEYSVSAIGCNFQNDVNYTIIDEPMFLHSLSDVIYCVTDAVFDYSIQNMQFVESITWSFPNDVVITSGGVDQPNISLDWSGSIGGQLCLEVANLCAQPQICVNYSQLPDPISPSQIDGVTDLCGFIGDTLIYSVGSVQSGVNYVWRIPAEASLIDQSQNGQIALVWSGNMFDTQLCVTAENNCSSSGELCINPGVRDLIINYDIVQPFCPDKRLGALFIAGVDGGQPPYSLMLDGVALDRDNIYIENLEPGDYLLEASDALGCTGVSPFTVNFFPETNLIIADLDLDFQEERTINILTNIDQENIDRVEWTPVNLANCIDEKCTSVIITGVETRTMTAEIFTDSGCSNLVTFRVTVNKTQEVYFPNAFTPNEDTVNDLYIISGDSGVERIMSISIFDRWGELIYTAIDLAPNDTSRGWDGRFKGIDSPISVYMYQSEVLFADGTQKTFSGDFTLIR